MRDLRIALVQMASRPGEPHVNLSRIADHCDEAMSRGAAIICFPELAVPGYGRSAATRAYAESIPGPSTRELEHTAQRTGLTILAGLLERGPDEAVFNTHVVVGPTGLLTRHRKTHVPINERPAFDAGEDWQLFDHPDARCGLQICYDAHFPELSAVMAADGAEVLFIPHASAGEETRQEKLDRWLRFLPARAYDNGAFVAVCNATGTTFDGEALPGMAFVLDPLGRIVAITEGVEEQQLVVDLDATLLGEARGDPNGFFLDYRRPGLYER